MAQHKFAIFVTIKCKTGMGKDFMPLIMENAVASMRDEPNCQEFRVMTANDDDDTFHFYEVYTDEAALDAHRLAPHYIKFRETADDMVEARNVLQTTVHI